MAKFQCELPEARGKKNSILLTNVQKKTTAIYTSVIATSAKLSSWDEPIGIDHLKARVRKESATAAGTLSSDTADRRFQS